MGILEQEFRLLHWPPLVREVTQTATFPGYRYEFFRSFRELDAYFTQEFGIDWRNEAWAEFWINQHLETKNDDRKELAMKQQPWLKQHRTGARDIAKIQLLAFEYLNNNPKTSSYKLVHWLASQEITVSQKAAWRIIKRWKANPDKLVFDDTAQRYVSSAYTHNAITPLGEPIPANYSRDHWRKDWNEKHGIG